MAIVSFKGKGVCARVCALPEPTDRNCCIRDQKIRKKEDFVFSSTVTCFISFLCAVRCRLNHMYRSIQLKWRHCYNSVISEWNWIFPLLQRPSGKSLPIWPLRGWKPCVSEAQWSWQTKSSVPPTHGLRPTPWTTPTTLAHSWCIFFDFLGPWHFD